MNRDAGRSESMSVPWDSLLGGRNGSKMRCRTTLPGTECRFAGKEGCNYPKGECQPIVPECIGCDKIAAGGHGEVCGAYPELFFVEGGPPTTS